MNTIRTHCTLGELQNLEVICMDSGKRLGAISEIELDIQCGRILAIRVPKKLDWNRLFTRGEKRYLRIRWENIERIGDDFIVISGLCSNFDPTT